MSTQECTSKTNPLNLKCVKVKNTELRPTIWWLFNDWNHWQPWETS